MKSTSSPIGTRSEIAVYHRRLDFDPTSAHRPGRPTTSKPHAGRPSAARRTVVPPSAAVDAAAAANNEEQRMMLACFARLQELVPTAAASDRPLSRVDLLQQVIDYILDLESTLEYDSLDDDDVVSTGATLPMGSAAVSTTAAAEWYATPSGQERRGSSTVVADRCDRKALCEWKPFNAVVLS